MSSPTAFDDFADGERVREAIERVEGETTAVVTVSMARARRGTVHDRALENLHARTAPDRKTVPAIHFYFVPKKREFAVVGNRLAHATLGQATFDESVALVRRGLQNGDATQAIVDAIGFVGTRLAGAFPKREV